MAGTPGPHPELAALIRARSGEILERWTDAVRAVPAVGRLPRPMLCDHVPQLLRNVANALEGSGGALHEQAARHALERLPEGLSPEDIVAELTLLRDEVLEVRAAGGTLDPGEVIALSRMFDAVITGTVSTLAAALQVATRGREEATAQVEALFQSAPVGLAFLDADLRFVRVNRRLAEMNGVPVEEHLGRTPVELLPGVEELEHVLARWRRSLETGEPWFGAELTGATPACRGERRTWREDFFPVRIGGEIAGIGAVVVDVTEQRRADERARFLARAGHELSEAIEPEVALARVVRLAVPELADWCALVLVREGAVARVAVETADSAQRALAQDVLERFPIDLRAPRGLGRVLREGTAELVGVAPEGAEAAAPEAREFLARMGIRSYLLAPMIARGRVTGAMALGMAGSGRSFREGDLAFGEEVAARCAIALENARLFEEARAEARMREKVLAIVSHDLRSPLSTVLMTASRLAALELAGPGRERVARAAGAIRRAATQMNRLIDDLLDAATIASGQLSVHPAPVAAGEVVREAVEPFRAVARGHRVELIVDMADGLPVVRADRDRVVQVLSNLLSNALKAGRPGGRIVVAARAAGAGEVTFSVSDDGPGIPEDEQREIFAPYRRGAAAGYRGAGLGLAIARAIVEAHGGRIWVVSAPGEGSTFTFTIPAARASSERAQDATPEPS